MNSVIFDAVHTHRLKSAEADMKSYFGRFDAALLQATKNFGREMKARGRSGDGTALASVNRLISFAVVGAILAVDVGRQGHVARLLKPSKKPGNGFEADAALAESAASYNLSLHFAVIAKEKA